MRYYNLRKRQGEIGLWTQEGLWTTEEDNLIVAQIPLYGRVAYGTWIQISEILTNRTLAAGPGSCFQLESGESGENGTVGHNNLDLDVLIFLEWVDDDEQDPEILLAAFLAFPGYPTATELGILKRRMKELFPPGKVEEKPTVKRRKQVGMAWNAAKVQEVEARAEKLGLPPWEIVQIRKKSWQIGLRKLRAKAPTPS